ncbi:hypothetical protein [Gimesia chilikensis]|uniref:RipA family octameric membrane protein n=1 Tax=Gimesia chilikensis TaxID=2605989 RepID=UPI0011A9099B|nr:hypothetical protein [Gimesia chilikensis]
MTSETLKEVAASPKTKVQYLLVEYSAAQSSAEHHDKLVWTLTSYSWTASFALYGIATEYLKAEYHKTFKILACIFGVALILAAWHFAKQYREIKNSKYNRCKEIESLLGMRQHQATEKIHKKRSQLLYLKEMTILFVFIWVLQFLNVVIEPPQNIFWYAIGGYIYCRFFLYFYPTD